MQKRRSPLLTALLMLILCTSVLVGATYAQFTDNVVVTGNVIQAGNLKAGLSYWAADSNDTLGWQDAQDETIFDYPYWEPGYTDVQYIKITNDGKLAFQYALSVEPTAETTVIAVDETNAEPVVKADLMNAIDVYYAVLGEGTNPPQMPEGVNFSAFKEEMGLQRIGTLNQLRQMSSSTWGVILPANGAADATKPGSDVPAYNKEVTACIVLHMQEEAGNEYMGLTAGNGFNLKLTATQYAYENDAFGNDYDNVEFLPAFGDPVSASVEIRPEMLNENNELITSLTIGSGRVIATVPAGVKIEQGTTVLKMNVMAIASGANIQLGETEETNSIDVHIEGIAADNTVPLQIYISELMPTGLNMGNYTLYHVENGAPVAMNHVTSLDNVMHNDFTYAPEDGDVTLCMATFSEVAVVADTENAWEGKFDYAWYDADATELTIANADQLAAFGAIVGGMAKDEDGNAIAQDSFSGKTVKLIADINLGDKESENDSDLIFYPIGYYNSAKSYEKVSGGSVTSSVNSFEGTFDGQGHTISNIYQNTWEMFGDYNDGYTGTPNHYKDAMGLFGYVYGGTVKNLTVDNFSSDGEFTPTGVIAAYADGNSTFENIAITNCNPRVYNTGNGGIIGIAGDTSAANDDHITLTNITVDNSNKISALWGSWDVACGGLVGMYRGNVDGNGNATGDTITFTNCHVSAQIDVYNDVCANYQYYAYRYAGMMIGSVRHNTTNDEGKTIPNMKGISASGCTVNYGDWNDYYYCEFEKNSMASYSEDYQFSRVDKSEITFNANGDITGCTHEHTAEEDKTAVYLPFHQLFTGYSWGVSSVGLKEYSGIVTDQDISEGEIESSVKKFDKADTAKDSYTTESPVTLGELFTAVSGVSPAIDAENVQVFVSPVGDDSTAGGAYVANSTDWTKGTLTFSGVGAATITITDYYFCTPTTINVTVNDPPVVDKFVKKDSLTFKHSIDNETLTKTLGDIFSPNSYEIDDENVAVTVDNETLCTYTKDDQDWANSTLIFTGTGTVTITITDGKYCNVAAATVTIVEPDYVNKFVANSNLQFEHTTEGGTIEKTLGDIFSLNGYEIDDENVAVTVDNETLCTYTKDDQGWAKSTLTFTGTGTVTITITDNNYCNVATATVTITEPTTPVDKFDLIFENTDEYLYRVGNANTVALGSLFKAKDGVTIGNVTVNVEPQNNATVSGTYTANTTDWTKGTIQFSGTGVVKVTIDDNMYANEETLYLEVVEAKNTTTATNATANNVVLLNDISGTFIVSNGYTFYGNGFTVKLPTTSVQEVGNGFTGYISIGASQDDGIANGGNLDNIRIEGPVYPEMYIYRDQAKITDSSDADYGSGNNMRYFKNSVIIYGGNCTISNSYISGSRTALCLRGGNNVVIENTTLSGGAYANMQICAGSKVTLRDLTTVQVDVADSYGKGKTAHGLGIAVDSNVVDIYIEGELNQYNWLCEEQWNSIVPSTYQSVFPKFFTNNTFSNHWHYLNGGTAPYVNLAFIYACNWDTNKIHDNRATVNYGTTNATIASVDGGVYSKVNTVGGNTITDADLTDPGYTSPGFNPVAPVLNFDNSSNNDTDDENDAADTYCVYDEASGTLKIGVSGDSKTIDLSGVTVTKNGTALSHTAYLNGTQISGNSVTIKAADGAKQTLTFKATSNDVGYDKDGNPIAGSIEYSWTVTVEMAVLSYPAPVWNMGGDYQFNTTNCYYAYYQTSQGYGEAVPIYEDIKVNYYNKSGTLLNLDLSGTTTLPTGSNNSNSNAFTYTLSDGSTLTMKFSSGWKSGATTHQFTTYSDKVYIYPQSLDNDNYVRAKTTNQDFNVKISYTFTDPNGQSTETVTMNWYNAAASNSDVSTVQWKTFDNTNGKEADNCVTPDTLIILADGSQVRVDSLAGDEQLLVWNMETGKLDAAPILFVDSDPETDYEIVHLYFSDGTDVKVIYEHGFWDYDLNRYVYLDRDAAQFIGHRFFKQSGNGGEKVQLTDVVIENEKTTAWSPVTVDHLCYFVNGMLSMPGGVGGLFNIFDVDPATMTYDMEALAKDIETYGLYTYDELNSIVELPEAMFEAAGGAYMKISIGKGNLTMDELIAMIQRYSKFF